MDVIGIISEYNPFHLGHLYHLEQVKEKVKHARTVCVMSGNFVQRGEPALVIKWARAEAALASGVDLVLELPALYAVRSAYWFARGGVETLWRTGVVTHLSFGVENDDIGGLTAAAGLLSNETPSFRRFLRAALKKGYSFPRARAEALSQELEVSSSLWSSPNNILALTYLQILQELDISFVPVPIRRTGSGYLQEDLESSLLPSASAIRRALLMNPGFTVYTALDKIKEFLPPATFGVLEREFSAGRGPVSLTNLAPQLMTLLRRSVRTDLQKTVDVTEGLESRLLKAAQLTADLDEYLALVKTKRFTYTRLQRFLIHLLLDYTDEKAAYLTSGPPYLRVLGFTARGRELLKQIKSKSTLPVITKGAHAYKFHGQSGTFRAFWDTDVVATNLYTLLFPSPPERKGNLDYFRGPVHLPN